MNTIVYKIKQGKDIVEYVRLASSYRLFVPGWMLSFIYREWVQEPEVILPNDKIVLAFDSHKPIGAAVCCNQYKPEVMLFVRKAYRRQGIGTKMVKMITHDLERFEYGYGNIGSLKFWPTLVNWEATI